MELSTVFNSSELQLIDVGALPASSSKAFIQANTIPIDGAELKHQHIIPVWAKDNEPLISHTDFIESAQEMACHFYRGEQVLEPAIRLSHPIKGRIPSAKDKSAKELLENERTVYYERMMFVIDIPSVADDVNGNRLSLTIGGVKAFNLDNTYNRKGALEHFKVFIGFKNSVCTNLCVSTDGMLADLKVRSVSELTDAIGRLIAQYSVTSHLERMKRLVQYRMTEHQFAQFLGKARLYQFLTHYQRKEVMPLRFSDTQLISVARDYIQDENFSRFADGSISLWNLYNLFTGSNKSSYIDSFLDRASNAFDIATELTYAVEQPTSNWFLS